MVRGRYLATFSCNSIWNQQKVGSGVGSGTGFGSDLRLNKQLAISNWQLAKSRQDRQQTPVVAARCYPATSRINSCFERVWKTALGITPSRICTARVDTRSALAPVIRAASVTPNSRSFDCAQDFACGLPLSLSGSLTPAKRLNIQLSKNELQAVYPWG